MDNQSFTIKCNHCGRETVIKKRKKDAWKGFLTNNKSIEINVFWGNEMGQIVCKCGNIINL